MRYELEEGARVRILAALRRVDRGEAAPAAAVRSAVGLLEGADLAAVRRLAHWHRDHAAGGLELELYGGEDGAQWARAILQQWADHCARGGHVQAAAGALRAGAGQLEAMGVSLPAGASWGLLGRLGGALQSITRPTRPQPPQRPLDGPRAWVNGVEVRATIQHTPKGRK